MLRAKAKRAVLGFSRPPLDRQVEFWNLSGKYTGFIGGVGSGKTFAGAIKCLTMPPGSVGMIVSPDYPMMAKTTLPALRDALRGTGILKGESKKDRYLELAGGRIVHYASAHDPNKLRGPNLGWFWIDEASFVKPETWRIMGGRLRKSPGVGWITTTPKGKRHWIYKDLVASGDLNYVTSTSRANHYNLEGFADSVESLGDLSWVRQEAFGEFVDAGGTVFLGTMFRLMGELPNERYIACRAWDCATTAGGGDWTVGLRMHYYPRIDVFLIVDIVRGQWGPGDVDAIIKATSISDGPNVPVILEQEGGSSGKRVNHYVRVSLSGVQQVIDVPSTTSKLTRAMPLARSAAAGRVAILSNSSIAEFIGEAVDFTGVEDGETDDQVDAASLAHNWLFRASGGVSYGSSASA
ncbi:hypothetical protein GC170_14555 [bacterium]|nr:hypothetical protein [bacterium]